MQTSRRTCGKQGERHAGLCMYMPERPAEKTRRSSGQPTALWVVLCVTPTMVLPPTAQPSSCSAHAVHAGGSSICPRADAVWHMARRYVGQFLRRTGRRRDGCAIFW